MKKTRKNNKTPYLVVTLACALLVTGLGGATLAKYVTEKGTDSSVATVAKWGYVITLNANDLFSKDYSKGENNIAIKSDSTGLSVAGEADRVAPGTSGSMTFSVIGQAEVASKITFAATGTDVYYDKTSGENDEYYPIKWTLTKNNVAVVTDGKLSEVATKLNAEKVDNNDPGTQVNNTYELSWVWALDGQDNVLDTYLGNIAAGTGETGDPNASSTTTQFTLNIKVEQIQK